jgi:hypothetical protein
MAVGEDAEGVVTEGWLAYWGNQLVLFVFC